MMSGGNLGSLGSRAANSFAFRRGVVATTTSQASPMLRRRRTESSIVSTSDDGELRPRSQSVNRSGNRSDSWSNLFFGQSRHMTSLSTSTSRLGSSSLGGSVDNLSTTTRFEKSSKKAEKSSRPVFSDHRPFIQVQQMESESFPNVKRRMSASQHLRRKRYSVGMNFSSSELLSQSQCGGGNILTSVSPTQSRRRYSSMSNLDSDRYREEDEEKQGKPEMGFAIGAAATATAAAIALLLIDPPAVFASESQHDEDDDEEMDMSELVQKCQITPNIDKEKWSESSGSFILQDLLTNTLYLVAHSPSDEKNSTSSSEESTSPSTSSTSSTISTTSGDDVTCNVEAHKLSSFKNTDDITIQNSSDVKVQYTSNVKVQNTGDAILQNTSDGTVQIHDVKDEPYLFSRRGSGRTLNASTIKSISKSNSDSDDDNDNDVDESNQNGLSGNEDDDDEDKANNNSNNNGKKGNGKNGKKEKIGFRDRKIIDYENRIRAYSTPDKIFRYFATYKSTQDSEIFMTPEDFLRSLTPGVKQPDGLGLDQFKKFDPQTMNVKNIDQNLPEDSIFHRLGSSGFVSFSDYVFMLTILSTSRRQFEIAFRMFDLNGDGDVDAEEFEKVQNIIRQTTSVGSRHRDHSTTGNTLKGINSALANYFFGENLDGKLTIDRFLDFQEELQRAILTLEFQRKDPNDEGLITEKQFAELLLTYADYSPKKRAAVLKRVKKKYKIRKSDKDDSDNKDDSDKENSDNFDVPTFGIALEDYIQIFAVLIHIDDVDKALSFYNLAGASIDKMTLKHVAKVCAEVDLRDHVIDVLFTIFDEDGDGVLSNREFVSVMKNKLKRGLEKPKDIGIVNLLSAFAKCAQTTPIPAGPSFGFSPV